MLYHTLNQVKKMTKRIVELIIAIVLGIVAISTTAATAGAAFKMYIVLKNDILIQENHGMCKDI